MRFCIVTTFYPPYGFGGDAVYVQQLSNELAKRGHQAEVVYCRDAYNLLPRRTPSSIHNDHPNVTVHALQSSLGFFSPLATHQTGRPLPKISRIKKILERPFDVIHYHNISLIGGPKILEYGHAVKLYTLHEYWPICPTHLLFKFNREACTYKQCLACILVHKRPPQFWRYTDMIEQAVKQAGHRILLDKNPGFLRKSPIGLLFPVKPNRLEYRALQPITIRSADLDPADWQGK